MRKICIECGRQFEAKRECAKYCSGSCKQRHRQNKSRVRKICEHCGTQFLGLPQSKHRFCSTSCGTSGTVVHKQLTCVDCGSVFQFIGRTTKLRCESCHRKHRSKLVMQAKARKNPQIRVGIGSGHAYQHPNVQAYTTEQHIRNTRKARRKLDKTNYVKNYRKLVLTGSDKCYICGYNARQQALVVHHINMNRYDSRIQNLAILCANCHAIVHADMHAALKQRLSVSPEQSFNTTKQAIQQA